MRTVIIAFALLISGSANALTITCEAVKLEAFVNESGERDHKILFNGLAICESTKQTDLDEGSTRFSCSKGLFDRVKLEVYADQKYAFFKWEAGPVWSSREGELKCSESAD